MKRLIIAIDGPAGAGKSTVAKLAAQQLGYTYIDTGAMYRAVAWQVLQAGLEPDNKTVAALAASLDLKLTYVNGKTAVAVNGRDITEAIRTPEVNRLVSRVAQVQALREIMLTLQRGLAAEGGVVMDGRDIGTHVLPNADIKIFLTASISERAQRRWQELTAKGYTLALAELENEIKTRDKADCEREFAPLAAAADAVFIDTTELSIQATVEKILELCKERQECV
ncbi:(d)CMP kinase [Sporomusa termitida]|uniref:Cytidylate kinase n=1 Tax=Sporomusa termitida TaxID=2377 RepID=A0A517DTS0_9FIRM|nr:(d)CMP kinase [Sporomusa termitida]QDR80749.1 Cytidylate kinase [Sporomusa termitida]